MSNGSGRSANSSCLIQWSTLRIDASQSSFWLYPWPAIVDSTTELSKIQTIFELDIVYDGMRRLPSTNITYGQMCRIYVIFEHDHKHHHLKASLCLRLKLPISDTRWLGHQTSLVISYHQVIAIILLHKSDHEPDRSSFKYVNYS